MARTFYLLLALFAISACSGTCVTQSAWPIVIIGLAAVMLIPVYKHLSRH